MKIQTEETIITKDIQLSKEETQRIVTIFLNDFMERIKYTDQIFDLLKEPHITDLKEFLQRIVWEATGRELLALEKRIRDLEQKMPRIKKLSTNKIKVLHNQGLSNREIGRKLNMHHSTVKKYLRKQ